MSAESVIVNVNSDSPSAIPVRLTLYEPVDTKTGVPAVILAGDLRVFLLVWPDSVSENIWKKQRSYWGGSNQNEIIICLGISPGFTWR